MDWTDETIAHLRGLWDEGHTTAEIGRRLGITKNAVVGKAHRLNLPARPSPIRRGAEDGRAARRAGPRRQGERQGGRQGESTLPSFGPDSSIISSAVSSAPEFTIASASETTRAPRPAEAPRPQPVLRAVPASRPAGRLSTCCWPIGEPGTSSFHFCGGAALPTKPYCAEHAAVAYVRVRDRREDAA